MSRRTPAQLPAVTLITALTFFLSACEEKAPTESLVHVAAQQDVNSTGGNSISLSFHSGEQPVNGVVTVYDLDRGPFNLTTACPSLPECIDKGSFPTFVKETLGGVVNFDVPAGNYSFAFAQFADVASATSDETFLTADPVQPFVGFQPAMEPGNFAPLVCRRLPLEEIVDLVLLNDQTFDNSVREACLSFPSIEGSFTGDYQVTQLGATINLRCRDTSGQAVVCPAFALFETLMPHPWFGLFDPPLQPNTRSGVVVSAAIGAKDEVTGAVLPTPLTNLPLGQDLFLEGILITQFGSQTFSAFVPANQVQGTAQATDIEVSLEETCCTCSPSSDESVGDGSGRTDYLPDVKLEWQGGINTAGFLEPLNGASVVFDQNPNGFDGATRAHFRAKFAGGDTKNGIFDYTHTAAGVCAEQRRTGPLFTKIGLQPLAECRLNPDGTVHVTLRVVNIPMSVQALDVSLEVLGKGSDKFPDTSREDQLRAFETIFRATTCNLSECFPDSRWSTIAG